MYRGAGLVHEGSPPSMWPVFDSSSVSCELSLLFNVGSRLAPRVLSEFLTFPPPNISNFQFHPDRGLAGRPDRADVASS